MYVVKTFDGAQHTPESNAVTKHRAITGRRKANEPCIAAGETIHRSHHKNRETTVDWACRKNVGYCLQQQYNN